MANNYYYNNKTKSNLSSSSSSSSSSSLSNISIQQPPSYKFTIDPTKYGFPITTKKYTQNDSNLDNVNKKFEILKNQLLTYDNSKITQQTNAKLKTSLNDEVQIYSRSNDKWCAGKICRLYDDGWIKVRYECNNWFYTKDIDPKDEHIYFPNWISPNLIVITTQSQGNGYKLESKLAECGFVRNVITWESDLNHNLIQMKILKGYLNIIIVGHHKHWSLDTNDTKYLQNNVDIVFKWSWNSKSYYYPDYKKMLKPDGVLMKIPLYISKEWFELSYIKQMLWNTNRFIAKLYQCIVPSKMQIPSEIQSMIIEFTRDSFVDICRRDEISK